MSKRRRLMIVLGVGLVIVALVFVLGSKASSSKIAHLGIHIAGEGPVLQCIVSNSNDRAVRLWPAAPQIKSNGVWPENVTWLPVRYAELRPKQTTQFTVMRPTNAEVWRVPITFVVKPPRTEWLNEVIYRNALALQSGTAFPGVRIGWGFTVGWTNYSTEIIR